VRHLLLLRVKVEASALGLIGIAHCVQACKVVAQGHAGSPSLGISLLKSLVVSRRILNIAPRHLLSSFFFHLGNISVRLLLLYYA
jgi:hypothetical protein